MRSFYFVLLFVTLFYASLNALSMETLGQDFDLNTLIMTTTIICKVLIKETSN